MRLSRCKPLAGGLEILNGERYVARSEPRLARGFFPTRFRKSQDWRNNAGRLVGYGAIVLTTRVLGLVPEALPAYENPAKTSPTKNPDAFQRRGLKMTCGPA